MTDKEHRFIAEYLVDLNGSAAAIRAGYSAKSSRTTAARLLAKENIVKELTVRKAAQIEKADLTATRVLEELRRLSFSDVRGLFDESGNLRPLTALTDEQAAAIASVEVVVSASKAGSDRTETIHKIKCWDKTRTLDLLARHFGLLSTLGNLGVPGTPRRVIIELEDGS